jgi:hypothetical protein
MEKGEIMTVKHTYALRILLIGFLLVSLSCSLLTGSNPSGSTSGSGNSAVTLSDNLPEETHPGDYISYQGYFFAVLQLIDPAPYSSDAVPQPGMRNVALEILTGNQNGDLSSPISLSFGGLGDGSSQTYMANLRSSGSGIEFDSTGLLDRGERARGWLDFSIPEGSQPVSLEMNLLNPQGGWIEFSYGLTPPPDGYAQIQADTSRVSPDKTAFGNAAERNGCSLKATDVKENLDTIPSLFFSMPPGARVTGVQFEIRSTKDSAFLIREIDVYDTEGAVFGMAGSENIQGQGQQMVEPGKTVEDMGYFVVPGGARLEGIRLICNDTTNPMEYTVLRSALA